MLLTTHFSRPPPPSIVCRQNNEVGNFPPKLTPLFPLPRGFKASRRWRFLARFASWNLPKDRSGIGRVRLSRSAKTESGGALNVQSKGISDDKYLGDGGAVVVKSKDARMIIDSRFAGHDQLFGDIKAQTELEHTAPPAVQSQSWRRLLTINRVITSNRRDQHPWFRHMNEGRNVFCWRARANRLLKGSLTVTSVQDKTDASTQQHRSTPSLSLECRVQIQLVRPLRFAFILLTASFRAEHRNSK